MAEEILIHVTPHITWVAVVQARQLHTLYATTTNQPSCVGNIYQGKILKVLPGLQAAFIDIGLPRAAFLHVKDVVPGARADAQIRDHLVEGRLLAVQVIKDPIGEKVARVTTFLTLPGRYLIKMPSQNTPAVRLSQRVTDPEVRSHLRQLLMQMPYTGLYIVRTAAQDASDAEICADQTMLEKQWKNIAIEMRDQSGVCCVYPDLPLPQKVMRDMAGQQTTVIQVDCLTTYKALRTFAQQYMPDLVQKIKHYTTVAPLFDCYDIEKEIQQSLQRVVPLPSGGAVVFDHTEAMTTIDVNTAHFVGSHRADATILKTNLEAVAVIARQLRLRNLGGMILIDFIDMPDISHQTQIAEALRTALRTDPVRTTVGHFSALGLIEVTRKRSHESLSQMLCTPCTTCQGHGIVKSVETVCDEIVRSVLRCAAEHPMVQYRVRMTEAVAMRWCDPACTLQETLEQKIQGKIMVEIDQSLSPTQFNILVDL